MKRILALTLTVVLLVCALTSCAFNYAKKSTDYASVDKAAFLGGLQNIKLTVQDYDDPSAREKLVNDEVLKALLAKADSDKKVANGVATAPDKIFYCYYATDAEGHKFFTGKMATGSAKSFQLGLSNLAELDKLIAEATETLDYSFGYKTTGTGSVPVDKLISISYTWEKKGETTETIVVTNDLVKLNEGSADEALNALYTALESKQIGEILDDGAGQTGVYKVDDNNSFKNAKVNFAIEQGEVFDISMDVEKDTSVSSETVSDETGAQFKKAELGSLTYHVYPINYIDVADFNAENVIYTLLGENIEPTTLSVFAKEDGTASDLFVKAEAYYSAKKAYDEAVKKDATTADSTALTAATTELKTADDDGNGGSKITAAYLELQKDKLQNNYLSNIEKEVYKAVWAEIKKIEVNNVPKKAVDNAYNALIDRYEYVFYQGTYQTGDTAADSESNYVHFNKSFEEYLKDATSTSDYAEAKAKVRSDAEEKVKETIRIYVLADAFDAKLVKADYTKENGEYKQAYDQLAYYEMYAAYGLPTFTEEAKLSAMQFDKVMKAITAHETNDGVITWKNVKTVLPVD